MEAFNIAVGVSNIVNCVTGVCTLGAYKKNESCEIAGHLDKSKSQLLLAFKDLKEYARDLSADEIEELLNGCQELNNTLDESIAATEKANYFIKRKNYKKILKDAQTLNTNTYKMIIKIQGKSIDAIAKCQGIQRKRETDGFHTAGRTDGPVYNRDSHQGNPFSDESTDAWRECHNHDVADEA